MLLAQRGDVDVEPSIHHRQVILGLRKGENYLHLRWGVRLSQTPSAFKLPTFGCKTFLIVHLHLEVAQ